MNNFLLLYFILGGYLILHSKYRLLCNEMFWMGIVWLLIFGVYLSSGVVYGNYGFSPELVIFLVLCGFSLLQGRNQGRKSRVKIFSDSARKHNALFFSVVGLVGVVMFVFDLVRLNGLMLFLSGGEGKNNEYDISMLGAIGSLLIPILFVEGLYLISKELREKGKFSIAGLLLLICYSIPCILNNGRESLAYAFIGITVLYGYHLITRGKHRKAFSLKKIVIRVAEAVCAALFIWLMINISSDRFGDNEINVFLTVNDVPARTLRDGEAWGEFKFLYCNILSYFSHQIAFLDFTLKEYDGPYMFGMYELNIISRRLPEFLGLDYVKVFESLRKLYSRTGISFSGSWNTVLGSFICDFGRIGTIMVCYIWGFLLGKVRRKFELTLDARYAVLVAIICATSFSTVQLGPFYNTLVYGTFIWWFVIFRKDEKKIIPRIYAKR